MNSPERDYVLGTHDEERERLGLQHRVWRPYALEAWYRAGLNAGMRVIDVGAGPGHAALDLAELVGPTGEVVAVERSGRYVAALRSAAAERGWAHLHAHELDLMTTPLPARDFDLAWCRWVACFVPDPARLVAAMQHALRPGGRVVFHEYAGYSGWRLAPPRPAFEDFVTAVIANWRAAGGEPDVALLLPKLLLRAGFRLLQCRPLVFALRPADYQWQWPATFVLSHLPRLLELGRVDADWCARVREEWLAAEAEPQSICLTPLVLEIIAERC